MKLSSLLPLSTLFFKQWAQNDQEVGVIVAKARFARHPDGRFRAEPAPDLIVTEVFEGDPAWSPLSDEQDIAPAKIGTDLVIKANARSTEGRLLQDWPVAVWIPDRVRYEFHVRGPTRWQRRRMTGWERTEPERIQDVPLTYALAYGGHTAKDGEVTEVHEANPAGIGFMTKAALQDVSEFPAPQIGLLGDFMVADPLHQLSVEGVGPVARGWLPRRPLAGTFDKDWLTVRHPRMPMDYDLAFWNCAARPLQMRPALRGGEQIILEGMSFSRQPVVITLPNRGLEAELSGPSTQRLALTLDTVIADIRSETPTEHVIDLVWRATVLHPSAYSAADLQSIRLES